MPRRAAERAQRDHVVRIAGGTRHGEIAGRQRARVAFAYALEGNEPAREVGAAGAGGKGDRALLDQHAVALLRDALEALVTKNDAAVTAQQGRAVVEPIEHLFEGTDREVGALEPRVDVQCLLKMRHEMPERGDFGFVNMALPARALNGNERTHVRSAFQNARDVVAKVGDWKQFGIEAVAIHRRFVEDLIVPIHGAGLLAQAVSRARIASCPMLQIGLFSGRRNAVAIESAVASRGLVNDLERRAGATNDLRDGCQRARP